MSLPPELRIKEEKKVINRFAHFGNTGDVIASLPALRGYYEKSGVKPILYLVKDYPAIYYEGATHPIKDDNGNHVSLNETMCRLLTPLLKCQPYLQDVITISADDYFDTDIQVNLSDIRNTFCNIPYGDIRRWYFYVFPDTFTDLCVPYISLPEIDYEIPKDKIIISRSERYQNELIDYSFIKQHQDDCLFIGTVS